ncbi:DUF551 domain-containing protein [Escherichia coli]|nr:DUF551 domain-containing protein [Escherichia coli]
MSNIDKRALRHSAESIIGILENIAGFEPSDIDGDSVETRFETEDGFDTGCDVSIVDQCQKTADVVRALLDELEAAENNLIDSECHVAELEEALRDKQALLEASEKRIAELEAELVSQTCKLNELSGNYPVTPDSWISCSERMPNDGQHVIILCDGAFVLYAQYRDGEFFDIVRNGDEFFETQSRNVTDWMPLPEPPQEMK